MLARQERERNLVDLLQGEAGRHEDEVERCQGKHQSDQEDRMRDDVQDGRAFDHE